MNEMQKLVKEIKNILDSNDWSNSPPRQEMAEKYAEFCQNYQNLVNQCNKLIDQNMVTEAVDLANGQEPPLAQQLKLLDFPGAESFRELGLIYEWPAIPELDHEVLEKLKSMDRDSRNLQPLLNAYRQIVRSDDVKTKVMLLRRLVQVDSGSKEWKNALVQQEEIWMAMLIRQTKDAIIEKKYDVLESLFEKISDPEWTEKAPEKVTRKIVEVLEQHRLDELKKKAAGILEAINDAYGNFDYDGLTGSLSDWQELVSRFGYQPEDREALQVKEAKDYWLQQKKQRAEDARFEELSEQLKNKLEKNAPQDELDMIYNQIVLMDRRPAEHIEQQYFAVKDNFDSTQQRKRILKITGIAAGILAVVGLIVFLIYMQVMSSTEKKWIQQLSAAMEESTSAPALALISNLQKERPDFAKRPGIARLIEKVNRRHEQEESNRKQFVKQAAQFRALLKDYERNRQKLEEGLKSLKRCIVDKQEQEVFDQVNADYNAQRDLFHARKKEIFERFITRINIKRGEFYDALEKVKLDVAAKIIEEIQELENQAKQSYAVISKVFPRREQEFTQSGALREKLSTLSRKVSQAGDLMTSINTPNSLEQLRSDLQEYLRLGTNRAAAGNMEKLLASVKAAQDVSAALAGNTVATENHFSRDHARMKKIGQNQRNALARSSEVFEKTNNGFEKTPFCSIILKTEDNLLVDLYFPEKWYSSKEYKPKWTVISDRIECKVKYIRDKDNNGTAVIKGSDDARRVSVSLNGEKTFSCRLVYPARLTRQQKFPPAPQILVVRKISDMLLQCEASKIEKTLADAVTAVIDNSEINPFLSLLYCRTLAKHLLTADPENRSYLKLQKDLASFDVPKNYNILESYVDMNRKLQQKLNLHLATVSSNMKLVSQQDFFLRLWNIMLSRKLVPAGFISADGTFHRFVHAPENGELWLIPAEINQKIRVVGTYRKGKIKLASAAKNNEELHYSLLFTPSDSKETRSIASEFSKNSDYAVFTAQDYPSSWPVF